MAGKVSRRPGRPRGGRAGGREELLAAARRLIAEGARQLDARSVAGAAGRGLGTLTHHFRDGGMHQLRAALAAQGYRDLEQAQRRALRTGRDAERGLRAMARATVDFALAEPALLRLMVTEVWDDEVAAAMEAQRQAVREQLLRCQATGVIRQGDPERVQRTGRVAFLGIALLVQEGHLTKRDAVQVAEDVVTDLLDGLRPRPPRARRS